MSDERLPVVAALLAMAVLAAAVALALTVRYATAEARPAMGRQYVVVYDRPGE